MSLLAFVKCVNAFRASSTIKASRETIATESSWDDQVRIDSMDRDRTDIIFELNKSVAQMHRLLEAGWDVLHDTRSTWDTPQRLPVFKGAIRILCDLANDLHGRGRVVLPPDLEKSRSLVFAASWAMVVSAQLLSASLTANVEDAGLFIKRPPLTLMKRIGDYSYVKHLLLAQRASMVISKSPVEKFSVTQWKFSLDGLCLAIHRFGLTPSAGAMLEALFHRYALWLIHDPADYDGKKEDELDAIFDHWVLCRPVPRDVGPDGDDADPMLGPMAEDLRLLKPILRESDLALNPRQRIGFVIQPENIFFYTRRHHVAFQAHLTHPLARPIVLSERWRRAALSALSEFVTAVLMHSHMKTEAIETIKNLILRRHLMSGEAERAHFESGSVINVDVDADSVLYDMRRDEFVRMQKDVLPLEIHAYFEKWAQEVAPALALPFTALHSDDEWDRIAAARPITERSAFLVFESAFDCLMKFMGVNNDECSLREFDYPDDAGIVPPYDAPPATPEIAASATIKAAATCRGTPALVCLAHAYMVVVSEPAATGRVQRVHVSPHLLDALGVWLATCSKRATLRLDRSPILAKLRPVILDPEMTNLLV